MAFDKKPSTWKGAGYTRSTNVLGFNSATASSNKTLPQVTNTDGDPTTGDIRILNYALCESMFQEWVAQAGNQPTKMTIRRVATTDSGANVRMSYIMDFIVLPGVPSTLASE